MTLALEFVHNVYDEDIGNSSEGIENDLISGQLSFYVWLAHFIQLAMEVNQRLSNSPFLVGAFS